MAGFKSAAQRERCRQLVQEGKMKESDFAQMEAETDIESLPERIHPKKPDNENHKSEAL